MAIESTNATKQGMQYQQQDINGITQANEVLTYTNTSVMAQLAQINSDMGNMQEHIKKLSTNKKKRK